MKIRGSVILFVAIATVLIVLACWFEKKKPTETASASLLKTNAVSSSVPAPSVNTPAHVGNLPPMTQFTANQPKPSAQDKTTLIKEILQANDADIVFYGRLEDQFSNTLGNVPINFEIRYENPKGRGVQRGRVTSDVNGLFTISGYKGERLSFIPEKSGYVLISRNNGGIYSPQWPEDQRVHPDPNNPTVIKMWKLQGGEHLIHFQTQARIPINGSPITFDLQTGQQIQTGGDIIIQVETTPTPNVRQRYDWQVKIQVVGGGLFSSGGDFERMLQAPDSNYEPEFSLTYQKDVRPWTTTYNGIFYLTSRNGNCYGKLGIEILSDLVKNGTVPVILNSYVNPSGSRNLEIDPAKITEAKP